MFNWVHAPRRFPANVLITVLLAVACLAPSSDEVTPSTSTTTKPSTQPAAPKPTTQPDPASRALVAFTAEPITLDGRLDEPVWQRAEVYTPFRPQDRAHWRMSQRAYEASVLRFARDERYFYAAFDFADENLVQKLDEDYQHHYMTGDVAELFLKPVDASHYWEFYATPHARRTVFYYPLRKRMKTPDEFYDLKSGLRVAVRANGTINEPSDIDQGWTVELAVPLDELAARGVPLDEDHRWQILVGRYNYGRRDARMDELSSFPALPASNFHDYERWIPIELEPRPQAATTAPMGAK